MATLDFSRENLNRFLRRVDELHLLPANTARTRKTAIRRLFAHLTEHEAADLRNVNVDELLERLERAERLEKSEGEQTVRSSRRTYHSRVLSVLKDFGSWVEDSAGFEHRLLVQRAGQSYGSEPLKKHQPLGRAGQNERVVLPAVESGIIALVPIRGNQHVVYVRNLPLDLTREEVDKIHAVLIAMVSTP